MAALLRRSRRSSMGSDGSATPVAGAPVEPTHSSGSAGPSLRAAPAPSSGNRTSPATAWATSMKTSSNRATRPGPGRITHQDWDALIHPDDRAGNHQAYLRPPLASAIT